MGNFKKLRVWEESVNLAANIYHITRKQPFSKDFGLSNQIQRAAVSIASNIAEGEERKSNKTTAHFFSIAKGSAAEVITQLHIAQKIGYINENRCKQLEDRLDKIRATLQILIYRRQGNYKLNEPKESYNESDFYLP